MKAAATTTAATPLATRHDYFGMLVSETKKQSVGYFLNMLLLFVEELSFPQHPPSPNTIPVLVLSFPL